MDLDQLKVLILHTYRHFPSDVIVPCTIICGTAYTPPEALLFAVDALLMYIRCANCD